jgi:MFS transporter, DHA1 family, multidrug resistance protein
MRISYMPIVKHKRLPGGGLTSGASYGATYAYLGGSRFVYIKPYHVPAQLYGWLFGVNICGFMATDAINGRLVRTVGSDRMMITEYSPSRSAEWRWR